LKNYGRGESVRLYGRGREKTQNGIENVDGHLTPIADIESRQGENPERD